ncbi:MAG: DNA-binding response regulator [Chloroflexi bacterium RBG_16_52_11]|nr:MAG: DNA-binding response regulator [Chloroflexi bacterium RBG_16_52_11]
MNHDTARILIVDDERPIRRILSISLGKQYTVLEAATGKEALSMAVSAHPEAIILDLGLSDMEGIEVINHLREWSNIPIIVVSVRDRESDKIAALDAGADDYLTKPFSIDELMARLRVALRHSTQPLNQPIFKTGGLAIDFARHDVKVEEKRVILTPTEYSILRILVQNAGKVLTHQQISHQVWGKNRGIQAHLLRVNISNLRHKLESNPSRPDYILTELGIGYRLMTIER